MDDRRLPLTDHLSELRTRIFRILITWGIASALAWSFSEAIFGLLLEPAVPMELSIGQTALYDKYSGSEVTVDNEQYLIIEESNVLAIVSR